MGEVCYRLARQTVEAIQDSMGASLVVLELICILLFHLTIETVHAEQMTSLVSCGFFLFSCTENFPACSC